MWVLRKHFRAAYALDPTYIPARQNLEVYGTFILAANARLMRAIARRQPLPYVIEYDEKGIGHAVRREKK